MPARIPVDSSPPVPSLDRLHYRVDRHHLQSTESRRWISLEKHRATPTDRSARPAVRRMPKMPCFRPRNTTVWLRPGNIALKVSRIPRAGTLVPPTRTPVVGPSPQLDLRGRAGRRSLFKHLTRPEGYISQHPSHLDPKLLRLNLSGFHG